MNTDDVQYLDWQWVEEHPESALDLMLELHSENARLREQIAALGEIGCLNLDDSTVAECDAVTGGEKYKDVLRRLFVEQPKEIAELRSLVREAMAEHVDLYDLDKAEDFIARAKNVLGEGKP